jgi:hypothetical protein
MSLHHRHFYRHMYGDKDTWRLAFALARRPAHLVASPPDVLGAPDPSRRFCGTAMLHRDAAGQPAWVHRTLQTLVSSPPPPRPVDHAMATPPAFAASFLTVQT